MVSGSDLVMKLEGELDIRSGKLLIMEEKVPRTIRREISNGTFVNKSFELPWVAENINAEGVHRYVVVNSGRPGDCQKPLIVHVSPEDGGKCLKLRYPRPIFGGGAENPKGGLEYFAVRGGGGVYIGDGDNNSLFGKDRTFEDGCFVNVPNGCYIVNSDGGVITIRRKDGILISPLKYVSAKEFAGKTLDKPFIAEGI